MMGAYNNSHAGFAFYLATHFNYLHAWYLSESIVKISKSPQVPVPPASKFYKTDAQEGVIKEVVLSTCLYAMHVKRLKTIDWLNECVRKKSCLAQTPRVQA